MKTLELIDRIQSLYSKGVSSDDSRLSSRHIYSKLVTVRQKLLSQHLKQKRKISDWNYTVLPCVELIKVPSHECSCLGNLGCDVYRTKHPLPKTLVDNFKHIIQFVMSIENGMKIEEMSREQIIYLKGNKYTKDKPKYVIENGHLYFPVQNSPGIVKIKFLAENPIEAINYPSYCEDCEECIECRAYDDIEFPIDGDLIDTVIELSLNELLNVFSRNLEDKTNDSADSNAEGTK